MGRVDGLMKLCFFDWRTQIHRHHVSTIKIVFRLLNILLKVPFSLSYCWYFRHLKHFPIFLLLYESCSRKFNVQHSPMTFLLLNVHMTMRITSSSRHARLTDPPFINCDRGRRISWGILPSHVYNDTDFGSLLSFDYLWDYKGGLYWWEGALAASEGAIWIAFMFYDASFEGNDDAGLGFVSYLDGLVFFDKLW